MKIFSPEWTQAYHTAINANEVYASTSKNWEAGPLALVLLRDGAGAAVLLELLHGACQAAHSLTPDEAHERAAFVIEGDEATWREVLGGQLQPLMGIMRGRLKLAKGSIARLLPYTAAATALVESARQLETEW